MPNVDPARTSPVSRLTPGSVTLGADVETPRVSTTTDASPALAKRRTRSRPNAPVPPVTRMVRGWRRVSAMTQPRSVLDDHAAPVQSVAEREQKQQIAFPQERGVG